MFDQLSERLQGVLGDVRSRGKLSEEDVDKALREVRLALLEADVNFKVVKDFTASLKERLAGAEISRPSNPGQTVVKAVNDELTELMGGAGRDLAFAPNPPTVILMLGPAGLGQDHRRRQAREAAGEGQAGRRHRGLRPAAASGRRAARAPGRAGQAHVYAQPGEKDPVKVAKWALDQAKAEGRDVLIVDTAGRVHVDEELMDELAESARRPSRMTCCWSSTR